MSAAKPRLCFECDGPGEHRHHVIAASLGGQRTCWLCADCHGKVHSLNFANHGVLTRLGLERRKAEGRRLGQPPFGWSVDGDGYLTPREEEQAVLATAMALRGAGHTYAAIADQLNDLELPTRQGSLWTSDRVRVSMLADERARAAVAG